MIDKPTGFVSRKVAFVFLVQINAHYQLNEKISYSNCHHRWGFYEL